MGRGTVTVVYHEWNRDRDRDHEWNRDRDGGLVAMEKKKERVIRIAKNQNRGDYLIHFHRYFSFVFLEWMN